MNTIKDNNLTAITEAIKRSISHTEITRTEIDMSGREMSTAEEMIIDLLDDADAEECDTTQENDGTYDVWGKLNGEDFRLRVFAN